MPYINLSIPCCLLYHHLRLSAGFSRLPPCCFLDRLAAPAAGFAVFTACAIYMYLHLLADSRIPHLYLVRSAVSDSYSFFSAPLRVAPHLPRTPLPPACGSRVRSLPPRRTANTIWTLPALGASTLRFWILPRIAPATRHHSRVAALPASTCLPGSLPLVLYLRLVSATACLTCSACLPCLQRFLHHLALPHVLDALWVVLICLPIPRLLPCLYSIYCLWFLPLICLGLLTLMGHWVPAYGCQPLALVPCHSLCLLLLPWVTPYRLPACCCLPALLPSLSSCTPSSLPCLHARHASLLWTLIYLQGSLPCLPHYSWTHTGTGCSWMLIT